MIYIIDYGLAKYYYNETTGQHISFCINKRLTGTSRYASLNTHLGYDQSRRDDLEGIGYSLIYLLKGSLPWQGFQVKNKDQKNSMIMRCKMDMSINELCKGLPDPIIKYMHYCRELSFEETPNYERLISLFKDYFYGMNMKDRFKYDWLLPKLELKDVKRSSSFSIPKNNKRKKASKRISNIGFASLHESPKRIEEAKESKQLILKVPSIIQSSWNESNRAEKDTKECYDSNYGRGSCIFNICGTEEDGKLLYYIDGIPNERPSENNFEVPLFQCRTNFHHWQFPGILKNHLLNLPVNLDVFKRSKSSFSSQRKYEAIS